MERSVVLNPRNIKMIARGALNPRIEPSEIRGIRLLNLIGFLVTSNATQILTRSVSRIQRVSWYQTYETKSRDVLLFTSYDESRRPRKTLPLSRLSINSYNTRRQPITITTFWGRYSYLKPTPNRRNFSRLAGKRWIRCGGKDNLAMVGGERGWARRRAGRRAANTKPENARRNGGESWPHVESLRWIIASQYLDGAWFADYLAYLHVFTRWFGATASSRLPGGRLVASRRVTSCQRHRVPTRK